MRLLLIMSSYNLFHSTILFITKMEHANLQTTMIDWARSLSPSDHRTTNKEDPKIPHVREYLVMTMVLKKSKIKSKPEPRSMLTRHT